MAATTAMNRRRFGATVAASGLAALVPSWLLPRQTQHAGIDLSIFCDPWIRRYDLARPFVQGDATYATDGRIALRLATMAEHDRAEAGRLPNAARLNWPDRNQGGWMPARGLKRVYRECCGCGACFGRGRIGSVTRCDTADECGDCYEHGVECTGWHGTECPECRGTGLVDFAYQIGGLHIAPSYLARLQTLPGCELKITEALLESPAPHDPEPQFDLMIASRFAGGEALLAPLVVGRGHQHHATPRRDAR